MANDAPILWRANFTILKNIIHGGSATFFALDNDASLTQFWSQNTVNLNCWNYIGSSATVPYKKGSTIIGDNIFTILNLHVFQYVATVPVIVSALPSTIKIVNKYTIVIQVTVGGPLNIAYKLAFDMIQLRALPFEDKMYFNTLVPDNGGNFQSYYLLVDPCMVRDPNNICTSCMPGSYYTDKGTAFNNCTWKSRLTAR